MVHVFVNHVATFETIVLTTVVEVHRLGITRLVTEDLAIGTVCNRSSLARSSCGIRFARCINIIIAFGVGEVSVVIVVISVNALITETVDTAECMSELNAAQVSCIAIVELFVL